MPSWCGELIPRQDRFSCSRRAFHRHDPPSTPSETVDPGLGGSGPRDDSAEVALALDAGLTLVQMAIAFVTCHPAVTSAIVGPRTTEHLETYLTAGGVDLSSDILQRIGDIVPPGDTVKIAHNMCGFGTSAPDAALRRR